MKPETRRTLAWASAYAVAMGVLEAAVVIYLRRLYFPGGFHFPMQMVESDIAVVELWREAATLTMLIAIGSLAGRTRAERFSYFIYCFGLWDLVYYAFLKLALGWPESLFTWDILFLLPFPWVGPVLAPCIVALTMCGVALTAIRFTDRGLDASMTVRERALLSSGAAVIIVSFTLDWILVDGPTFWGNITGGRHILDGLGHYVPQHYPWWIFLVGWSLGLASWFRYARRPRGRVSFERADLTASRTERILP